MQRRESRFRRWAEDSAHINEVARNLASAFTSVTLALTSPGFLILAWNDPGLREPVLGLIFGVGPSVGLIAQLLIREKGKAK